MAKRQVVTTVLVNDVGEVLILKRSDICPYPGRWNFPGGSVDDGEDLLEAAAREVEEETGLKISHAKILGKTFFKKIALTYFITRNFTGKLKLNQESGASRWVPPENLKKYEWPIKPIQQNIVDEIVKFIQEEQNE